MKQKYFYIILLILFLGVSKAFSLSLNEVWNHSTQAGTATAEGWDATLVRNMAYGNGKLYLVYDHADIKVINATTGEFIKNLSKSGASGGYYTFCDVAFFDGKVVACNLTLNSATANLKVYVWDDDDANPRTILSTSNTGGIGRLGDQIGLYGNLTNGKISFGNVSTIVDYTISGGTVNKTPSTVSIEPLTYTSGFQVQPLASGYYVNGKNGQLRQVSSTGTIQNTFTNSSSYGIGFSFFDYKGKSYALLSTSLGEGVYQGGAMQLHDISSGWSTSSIGTYPLAGLGTDNNSNCTGAALSNVASNYVETWVLSTHQGIAYYKSTPEASFSVSPTSVDFKNVIVGDSKQETFTISTMDVINNVYISSSNSSVFSVSPSSVGKNGGSFTVTFKPAEVESYDATITLSSSGMTSKTISVYGEGDPLPEANVRIAVPVSSLSFVANRDDTKSQTVEITGVNLTSNISVSSNSTYFKVNKTSLPAGGGSLKITFSPDDIGNYSGKITLSSTGAETKIINLTAEAIPAIGDEEFDFNTVYTKTNYSWNTGNASRDIAYHNGKIYAIDNGTTKTIRVIDAVSGDALNSQNITNSLFNSFSITTDEGNGLYIPSGNTGGASNWRLSRVQIPNLVEEIHKLNGTHTAIGGTGMRTDFIEAFKTSETTTYIAGVTTHTTTRLLRVWTVNQANLVEGPAVYDLGDACGAGADVKWISEFRLLVTASGKLPVIVKINMDDGRPHTLTEINTTTSEFGGGAYFRVNGIPYVALPINGTGKFKILNITKTNKPVTVYVHDEDIGSKANGSAHVAMEAVVEGNLVTLYVWSPNNGLSKHTIEFPPAEGDVGGGEEDGKLKRELRATWLTTAWNIDWPQPKTATIANQKAQLIDYLDKLKEANMNAVFLQIRPMADRMYAKTSMGTLVPWSEYASGTRGTSPGYDPLGFAIEEAHKRGIELHGWMNPYRYHASASIPSAMSGWVLNVNGSKILDPGLPAARQHIADVTRDIIVNYPDIDGIVWDDYFYIEGIANSHDQTTYNNNNPKGLGRADWRRDNVNKTVELVYNTIQEVNPGIRFGISPRGIWGTGQSAADQYGVTLPAGISGNDNYNSIYCDAMAWLSQGTIDYISPQLYWPTYPLGGGKQAQDYYVLCPWWQSVANKFGRHFYSSKSVSFTTAEVGREIDVDRSVNLTSPGSVFYSTIRFMNDYKTYVQNNHFNKPILPPVITWKAGNKLPKRVDNVKLSGNVLSWNNSLTDVSFVIFAVPKSTGVIKIEDCDYMLTRFWTNTNSYTLPEQYQSLKGTHNFAIAVVNRYGAMSEPKFESSLTTEVEKTENIPAYKIYSNHAGLHIELEQAEQVNIFTLSGVLHYKGYVENALTINLPQGVYLVKIGSKTVKVVR